MLHAVIHNQIVRQSLTAIVLIYIVLSPCSSTPVKASEQTLGLSVGTPMVDFGLRSLVSNTRDLEDIIWLSDFVGKERCKTPKKLLLLNFFAVWCKPCLEEFPFLVELQQKHSTQGLQVLSVNYRTESEKLNETIKSTLNIIDRFGINFPILFDRYTNRNQRLYMGSQSVLPCNILIDENGIIIARFQGKDETLIRDINRTILQLLNAVPLQ